MSTWTSYQQKISPGFRNVVQALQDHYTENGVTFDQFYAKSATDIQTDLQALSPDSAFYLQYANSILSYVINIPAEFGSPNVIYFNLLTKDQQHYQHLQSGLTDRYPEFTELENAEPESLASSVFEISNEQPNFLLEVAEMLHASKTVSVWDHFILSFPIFDDKEAEALVTLINNTEEGNINSFRLFSNLSIDGLSTIINEFSEGNSYKNLVVSAIQNRAKVLLEQGTGSGSGTDSGADSGNDTWSSFFSVYSDEKRNAIQLLIDNAGITTLDELSLMEFSTLAVFADYDFFNSIAPYYLENALVVAESNAYNHRFNAQLRKTNDNKILRNFKIDIVDQNDSELGDRFIGTTTTNSQGYFKIEFSTLESSLNNYSLELTFTSLDDNREYVITKNFNDGDEANLHTFTINHDALDLSLKLTDIESLDEGITITPTLQQYLNDNQLTTLETIRDYGGILDNEALAPSDVIVANRFHAYSALEGILTDLPDEEKIEVSKVLINNEMTEPAKILKKDRYAFIRSIRITDPDAFNIDDYLAGRIYEQASSVMSYINSRMANGLATNFEDFSGELKDKLNSLRTITCQCSDCKAGTSPLAYLADLINYSIKNISVTEFSFDLIDGLEQKSDGTVGYEGNDFLTISNDDDDSKLITHQIANRDQLTLNELEERFKHPFAQLPANCSSVNQKICQVRICIEVLWTYLFDADNGITTNKDLVHQDGEGNVIYDAAAELKAIRQSTYEFLLNELGTSYEEIRASRAASEEERQKLADRMGIPLANLEEYNIPYSTELDTVSDIKLEELFGLRDLSRNYKAVDQGEELPNALVTAPKSRYLQHREAFMRQQFHDMDFSELPYTNNGWPKIDPDVIFPGDFREPYINDPSNADSPATNPIFALWQHRFNWLTNYAAYLKGSIKQVSTYPKSKIIKLKASALEAEQMMTLSLTPAEPGANTETFNVVGFTMNPTGDVASLALSDSPPEHLLTTGEGEAAVASVVVNEDENNTVTAAGDFEADISSEHTEETKWSIFDKVMVPVTYSFMNVGDFTGVSPMANGEDNDQAAWIGQVASGYRDHLDFLYQNLKNKDDYENTLEIIEVNFAIDEAQFLRLYELFDLDRKAKLDEDAKPLKSDQIDEIIDILISGLKNRLKDVWISEEDNLVQGLQIDVFNFWKAEKSISTGKRIFPESKNFYNEEAKNIPLIDPELTNLKDLPDWKIDNTAKQIYKTRLEALEAVKSDLRITRYNYSTSESNGFLETLQYVYGGSIASQISAFETALASDISEDAAQAVVDIEKDLLLTLEQFTFIVDFRNRSSEPLVAKQPLDSEWSELYSMLIYPYKVLQLYPSWRSEEAASFYEINGVEHNLTWRLRHPKLRKLRNAQERRQAWQRELEILSRQPMIDPYIVSLANIKGTGENETVLNNNAVFELWNERRNLIESYRRPLEEALQGEQPFQIMNMFLSKKLKLSARWEFEDDSWTKFEDDLDRVHKKEQEGQDIRPLLTQMGFTRSAYKQLFNTREAIKNDATISLTPHEAEEIANLLTNTLKEREFTIWNLQERLDPDLNDPTPFSLGPDFFVIAPPQEFKFPPEQKVAKPKYLYNKEAANKWNKELKSKWRIWENAADSQKRLLKATETRYLAAGRDVLIHYISAAEGWSLDQTHDFINRSLLIDSKMSADVMTTRASAAIEALQVLIWGLHNKILIDEPGIEQMTIEAPEFEDEWKWLGSYATWRAAMFIQLYPENMLLPSLKPEQSEGYRKALKGINEIKTLRHADIAYHDYFQYVEDIQTLEMKGNLRLTTGHTRYSGVSTSYKAENLPWNQEAYFLIGQGQSSSSYYLKEIHLRRDNLNVVRSSDWFKIPIEISGEFVGFTHCTINKQRDIHIFFQEENKLMQIDYKFRTNSFSTVKEVSFKNTRTELKTDLDFKKFILVQGIGGLERPMFFYYGYNTSKNDYDAATWRTNYNEFTFGKHDFVFEPVWQNEEGSLDSILFNDFRFNPGNNGIRTTHRSLLPMHAFYNHKESSLNVYCKYLDSDTRYKNKIYAIRFFWGEGAEESIDPIGDRKYDNVKTSFLTFRDDQVHAITTNKPTGTTGYFSEVIENRLVNDSESLIPDLDYDSLAKNSHIPNIQRNEKLFLFYKKGNEERIIHIRKEVVNSDIRYKVESDNLIVEHRLNDFYRIDQIMSENPKQRFDRFGRLNYVVDYEKIIVNKDTLRQSTIGINEANTSSKLYAESFFYLPLAIANKLTAIGEYEAAKRYWEVLFDFSENTPYLNFLQESNHQPDFEINDSWGDNPLNPHSIAIQRHGAVRKSFYLQLINYFITYANHEFAQDNVESIARAKQLYLEAEELLQVVKPQPIMANGEDNCFKLLNTYTLKIDSFYVQEYWERLITRVVHIESAAQMEEFLNQAKAIWEDGTLGDEIYRMNQIEINLSGYMGGGLSSTIQGKINRDDYTFSNASYLIASHSQKNRVIEGIAQTTGANFDGSIGYTLNVENTGHAEALGNDSFLSVPHAPMPATAIAPPSAFIPEATHAIFSEDGSDLIAIDILDNSEVETGERKIKKPLEAFNSTFNKKDLSIYRPSFEFCVAENPMYKAYDLMISINLYKIRNSMNISGIQRSLEPFAAPTDTTTGIPMIGGNGLLSTGGLPIPQASTYRYSFLLARAKEMSNMSQNIEASFLSALEKYDGEVYNLMKAKQDQEIARSTVQLQDLRIDEAETGIDLSKAQTERAQAQIDGLQGMIDEGLNEYEDTIINNYRMVSALNILIQSLNFATELVKEAGDTTVGVSTNAPAKVLSIAALNTLGAIRLGGQVTKTALETSINVSQLFASQARREQEWNYQKSIASQDLKIGQLGEKLAQDRLRIVKQEKEIAELQLTHTDATINYLRNEQFTNAALYEFMVEMLEKVYSYFLQEATAAAKMAARQLAFERQQNLPEFIKGDYWIPEVDSASNTENEAADFKGMTGSARLLQDINRLEQYGNSTDERKQRITKTFSLANLTAFEFQQFKETGVLTFATSMEQFDKDFPGHYLRLIKSVKADVIALVPPVEGIKASLSSIGLSRVVTGGPLYQTQDIRRMPETISLSAPMGTNGIFELQQDEKFLKPFEGSGVETFWEFRMEKAANPNLNYNAIADILITIEYESLISFDYRARVVSQLNQFSTYQSMLPISFKSNLPDQWFDISNPDQAQSPFDVSFTLSAANFPVNVKNPIIDNVLLYFSMNDEEEKEIGVANFEYTEEGSETILGGEDLNSSGGKISTADPNGSNISGLLGKSAAGKWRIRLKDTPEIRQILSEDQLQDILLVITFSGNTPTYNL